MAYRVEMTAAERAEQARASRQAAQKRAEERRQKEEARQRAGRERFGYEQGSRDYARDVMTNAAPGFEGRANRFIDKLTDDIGDAIRSGASAIGIDNDFDTGRMQARKEIKGYKKGGKVKAKAKKPSQPKIRGVRPCKMVKMKGA